MAEMKTDSDTDDEIRGLNSPFLNRALRDWRSRQANDGGALGVREQAAGGVSREGAPREDVAAEPGSPVGIHGTGIPTDFEAPWYARLAHDLALQQHISFLEPLFPNGMETMAQIGPSALPTAERPKFLLDLFYQEIFYSSRPAVGPQQTRMWWARFCQHYKADAEGWLEHLERTRDAFECSTVAGAKMRLHRVSIQAGLGCAVSTAQACPCCSLWTPKLQSQALLLAASHGTRSLPKELYYAMKNLTDQLTALERRQQELVLAVQRVECLRQINDQLRRDVEETRREFQSLQARCSTFSASFAVGTNKRPFQEMTTQEDII